MSEQQLDLLLLKAESYSHFIVSNLKDSSHFAKLNKSPAPQDKTPINSSSKSKKRTSTLSANSSQKKSKSLPSSSFTDADASEEITDVNDDRNIMMSPSIKQPTPNSKGNTFCQPSNLVGGKLLPYQLEGLQWLLSLWENGLSGILADEMGLGKTIQVISLIAHLRSCDTPGPYIIVAPLATVPNWYMFNYYVFII